ncbi:MAG: hypothetical protein AAF597_21185, partial [Bacteroidota bacterium]
ETLREITMLNAQAVLVKLPMELPAELLSPPEVLIITLPPGGRKLGPGATETYLASLASLEPLLEGAQLVIFTSSTGVYGAAAGAGVVDEETPPAPSTYSSQAVVAAEGWLQSKVLSLAILRLAGLIGPGRDPGRFYGGSARSIPRANAPVNLVHQADVISAIQTLIANYNSLHGGQHIFNVCAAAHPSKGDFYTAAAALLNLPITGLEPGGHADKIIDSTKLRRLGWEPAWDSLLR